MITQKNRDTRCKYGVTILCLFFITIFCGCITEEERIAQMNAEKAKQERIEKLRKELQERQERSNKLSSIITSTDISYLGDLAKNNDDSTFRNAAINRLINLISPSHVAVKIDPMMRGTRSIRYVMGTKENAVYVSAEMARSTDPNVIMRIAQKQQEVSQKLSEQQKEQITNRSSEVINCIIDIASNSKFEDVKLKLIDINPPDAALLQKIAMCDNEKVAFAAIEKLEHAKHPFGNSQKSKRLSSFASYANNRVDIPDGIIRTLKEDDIRELAVEVETQKELELFSKIVNSPRWRFGVWFETINEGDDHVSIVSLRIGDKRITDLSPKVTKETSKDWFVEIAQNAKAIAVRKYAVQKTTNRKLLIKLQFHDTDESVRTAAKLRLDELTEKKDKIAKLVEEYHWKEILEIGKDDTSIASSVELAKNQIRREEISKNNKISPETSSNAIRGIRNQYFLMEIVTNNPGRVEGKTALDWIHIAKVLKGKTDDEIIAFATCACKYQNSNCWNGALDKAVKCIDLCSKDCSKAKI